MKAPKARRLRVLTTALVLSAMLIVAAGCSAQQAPSSAGGDSAQSPSSATAQESGGASAQGSGSAPTAEQYETALSPTNIVSTFIGESFYDQKVTNEDEALAAVKSVYDRIGADETTDLEIRAVRPTETGTTYYIFNQVAGDVFVYGASVKAIVDKDGTAIGLVSAILPNVELAKAEDWEVTAEQAEKIVIKHCKENGYAGVKTVEGSTEQTIIPIPSNTNRSQMAWVVYTNNYDSESEMAYLAHYVDATGIYMYAIPVAEPHDADSEAGDTANFDFSKYAQDTWKGTLTLHDGTTRNAEVPVLVDENDGTVYLADGKRKILCADYAKWAYKEKLSPRVSTDASFSNVELLAYDSFIKVWDFYDSIGWTGPDDEGTPTLLLMDYVNENGEPVDNAMYSGRQNGFQVFTFNRLNPDGENMDIIAHEFTHCVTSTTMTTILYLNDMGAINEGMSDVLGNLVEMIVVNKPETAWLMGDSSGVETLRSMKSPHDFLQPEFKWDTYYAPKAVEGTQVNDKGGVHVNSSLLNIVSYKLDQAGMQPNEQFYYWMNVALAMSPNTDYEQMAQLLPWCLEQSGYAQYGEALKAAIDEAKYTLMQEPETPPAGSGLVTIAYDAPELRDKGLIRISFTPADKTGEAFTWPAPGATTATCTLSAGDYICSAEVGADTIAECTTYLYKDGSWQLHNDGEDFDANPIHVEEGKTLELSSKGLPKTLDAVGK